MKNRLITVGVGVFLSSIGIVFWVHALLPWLSADRFGADTVVALFASLVVALAVPFAAMAYCWWLFDMPREWFPFPALKYLASGWLVAAPVAALSQADAWTSDRAIALAYGSFCVCLGIIGLWFVASGGRYRPEHKVRYQTPREATFVPCVRVARTIHAPADALRSAALEGQVPSLGFVGELLAPGAPLFFRGKPGTLFSPAIYAILDELSEGQTEVSLEPAEVWMGQIFNYHANRWIRSSYAQEVLDEFERLA